MKKILKYGLGIAQSLRTPVSYLWTLSFLYQFGFLLSWVIIISFFIDTFGIQNLGWFFVIEGALMIIGSFLHKSLFLHYDVNRFLVVPSLVTFFCIVAASFFPSESFGFFAVAMIAKSLLYPQIRLAILRKVETFFSPRQARKAMPKIESALTFGFIFGALIVLGLHMFFPTKYVFLFWGVPVLAVLVLSLFESNVLAMIPKLHQKQFCNVSPYRAGINRLIKKPFLAGLALLVLVSSVFTTVIEHGFLSSVNQKFQRNTTIAFELSQLKANIFEASEAENFPSENSENSAEYAPFIELKIEPMSERSVSAEHILYENLVHELGLLSLVFGLIALFVQLVITTPILNRLGVIRSILVYFGGAVAVIGAFAFGAGSMSVVRGYGHGFHSLFLSPYHLMFYAVEEHTREWLRHFLEGVLLPLGMVIGGLFIIQNIASDLSLLFGSLLVIFPLLWWLHRQYQKFSAENFFASTEIEEKIHHLQMLEPHVSDKTREYCHDIVRQRQLRPVIRESAVKLLQSSPDPRAVHAFLEIIRNDRETIQMKNRVLESMLHYQTLRTYCQERSFTQKQLRETLEKFFDDTPSAYTCKLIVMNYFRHLPSEKSADFFLKLLKTSDEQLISIALRSCQHCDDPEMQSYIQPYLEHTSPRVCSHAVAALWNFRENRESLVQRLAHMLENDQEDSQIAALYTLGELQLRRFKSELWEFANHSDGTKRFHALVALTKCGSYTALRELVDIIVSGNERDSLVAFQMCKRLPDKMYKQLRASLRRAIGKRVQLILRDSAVYERSHLHRLSVPMARLLRRFYSYLENYQNVHLLDQTFGVNRLRSQFGH